MWAACAPAWAINKCVDAAGKTVYQEAPCPSTHQSKPVNKSGAGKGDPDSEGARYWSRTVEQQKIQEKTDAAIRGGRVFVGMTADDVVRSWGKPNKINRTVLSGLVSEQWVYERGSRFGPAQYVYVRNGVVDSVQTTGDTGN